MVYLAKNFFNSLRIILYSGAISYIILGKHTKKLRKKNTNPVRWSTQGGGFNTNYTSKVEIVLRVCACVCVCVCNICLINFNYNRQ